MRALLVTGSIACLLASAPARSDDAIAAAGKLRAAASRLEWDVRDGNHPVLGPVRFAHLKLPIATPVGPARVYSNAYVSCEPNARTIAIELTNQRAPDDPGGLPPAAPPRLVCKNPAGQGGGTTLDAIDAKWQFNNLGDALARGLAPSALRSCAAIGIVEEVALPERWERRKATVEFEVTPYARGLDAIFASCGERSAYVAAPVTQVTPIAPATPVRSVASAPPPPASWKTARTVAHGKTNVRARPTTRSAVVTRLDPGAVILVQRATGDWWRAKSRNGDRFEGYVRADRLAVQ